MDSDVADMQRGVQARRHDDSPAQDLVSWAGNIQSPGLSEDECTVDVPAIAIVRMAKVLGAKHHVIDREDLQQV